MSDTIWGAEAIGREAGLVDAEGKVDLRKTFYLLELGRLPGKKLPGKNKKVGRIWVSSASAIRSALAIETAA
jgi:hypothetical protein